MRVRALFVPPGCREHRALSARLSFAGKPASAFRPVIAARNSQGLGLTGYAHHHHGHGRECPCRPAHATAAGTTTRLAVLRSNLTAPSTRTARDTMPLGTRVCVRRQVHGNQQRLTAEACRQSSCKLWSRLNRHGPLQLLARVQGAVAVRRQVQAVAVCSRRGLAQTAYGAVVRARSRHQAQA